MLDRALWNFDLILPRNSETENTPEKLAISTVGSGGAPALPFFTSLPKLEAWGGSNAPRVRCRFDNFEEALWEEFRVILNPGDRDERLLDPRLIRPAR